MTSEPQQAFVWVWLPGATDPVVAGRLDSAAELVTFTYGQSYLAREDRIALYLPELPLERGRIPPLVGDVAGCIADAAPDAWGRRVILNRHAGLSALDTTDLNLLTYLLESGSDRIGALDFQSSASRYVARRSANATLDELAEYLGLPVYHRHHALGDALTTAQVFLALATHLDEFTPESVRSLDHARDRVRLLTS